MTPGGDFPMDPSRPRAFHEIAGPDVTGAFISGYPEVVRWIAPGTKLFKWTTSVTTPAGVSPWMSNLVGVSLVRGAWAYIGRAAGQPKNRGNRDIWFIGGEYQVWVPGLRASDLVRISLAPYL
jgi:hypothetical protein